MTGVTVNGSDLAYEKPVVREIADLPHLVTGPPRQMLEVVPSAAALAERGVSAVQFWTALAELKTPDERPDASWLLNQSLRLNGQEVQLADVASLNRTTQPAQIAAALDFAWTKAARFHN